MPAVEIGRLKFRVHRAEQVAMRFSPASSSATELMRGALWSLRYQTGKLIESSAQIFELELQRLEVGGKIMRQVGHAPRARAISDAVRATVRA